MIEDNKSWDFKQIFQEIEQYARFQDILTFGFPEGQSSNWIQIIPSEIEALEDQYLLAFIIKKTEKIYQEIKEKTVKKRRNHISIRNFFVKSAADFHN